MLPEDDPYGVETCQGFKKIQCFICCNFVRLLVFLYINIFPLMHEDESNKACRNISVGRKLYTQYIQ